MSLSLYKLYFVAVAFFWPGYGFSLTLNVSDYKEIKFGDIAPTLYTNVDQQLKIVVNSSSSALLLPFKDVKKIKNVDFSWKTVGDLKLESAELEMSKAGDDARLRVGFLIAGEAPFVPFFASSWIKKVREFLTLSSDKMIYLIPTALITPGTVWENPYSGSISNRAISSKPQGGGWQAVKYRFKKVQSIVGVWLQADGDNSHSNFETYLRNLDLSEK